MKKESAPTSADEARIEPRFPPSAVPTITGVRLSPGDSVVLVNISRSGLLVQGRTRFVPGTSVTVYFEGGFTPNQMRGKIVRCQVSSIVGGTLVYQSGIQLDTLIDITPGQTAAVRPPAAPAPAPAGKPDTPAARRTLVNRW
jgi:hypothetical protein